jgi:hypothetical protein
MKEKDPSRVVNLGKQNNEKKRKDRKRNAFL